MTIELNGQIIEVVIKRKNNKNIYLRFLEDGKLYITCSRLVSLKEIEQLIQDNSKKLIKMYTRITQEKEDSQFFCYLGKKYTIVLDGITKDPYFDGDFIFARDEKTLEKFKKKEMLRIFTSEVEKIKPYFKNIPEFTLKIRSMKTRWGVCNRGNNTITLNSELLKKDIDLLDYVIVHELCHFYEPNHSNRFWTQVSRFYPNYKEARKRLKGE